MYKNINIDSREWDQLSGNIKSAFELGNLALLLGSGISHFSPSNIPMGSDISRRFRRELIKRLPSQEQIRVNYLTHNIPFEALMARLTELNPKIGRDIVMKLTTISKPNKLHLQIADLFKQAFLKDVDLPIITTNYDMGVTEALRTIHWPSNNSEVNPVIRELDIPQTEDHRTVFHIHGSTVDPESFVLDYNTEFQMEVWKKQYLRKILHGKTLLVLGFSGYDLDVSEALATVGLKRLIWVFAKSEECNMENWSAGARNLADAIGHENVFAINVNYKIQRILEPFTFPIELNRIETEIEERFQKVIEEYDLPDQPWFSLWARWTAVRAGCWELAYSLPKTELALLPLSYQMEIESFGYFYSGRHAKGATLQKRAAFQAENENEPFYRYLYHRNNEAEFYNRGGLTIKAIRTVFEGVWHYSLNKRKREGTRNNLAVKREIRNLLSSLTLLWPLPAIFVATNPLQALFRRIIRYFSNFNQEGDLDKFTLMNLASAHPDEETFKRGEDRFVWLGQRARLINLYRIFSLRQMLSIRREIKMDKLRICFIRSFKSTVWAGLVNDPCRYGKSCLVLLEVNQMLKDKNREELEDVKKYVVDQILYEFEESKKETTTIDVQEQQELDISNLNLKTLLLDLELSEEFFITAQKAWFSIRSGEVGFIYHAVGSSIYRIGQKWKNRYGRLLRLIALSLLETS